MKWDPLFRQFLADLKAKYKKGVIVCGDMNVARSEIDLKNPKANVCLFFFRFCEVNQR
jgi:exodeoxyribonuclease-3